MRWRRRVAGLGCMAGAVVLAACATPGYSPSRIQSELVRAGATPEQARCVAQLLPEKIDLQALGSHSTPPKPINPSATSSTSSTSTISTVEPTASSATTTTTIDEYQLTRSILKRCKVTLPLQPPP